MKLDELTEIERKIVELASAGEEASFDRDADGNRPTVRAKVLADIWQDRIEGYDISQFGLSIGGLRVTGSLNLGGAKQTSKGRDCLVGFRAEDCIFEEAVELVNIRSETLIFDRCELLAGSAGETGSDYSLILDSARIFGSVSISQCTFAGELSAESLVTTGMVSIVGCQFRKVINLWSARVGDTLTLVSCKIGGDGGPGLLLPFAVVEGRVQLGRLNCAGGIYAPNLVAAELRAYNLRLGATDGTSALFVHAQIAGEVHFSRIHSEGAISLSKASVRGDVAISKSKVAWLQFSAAEITGDLMLFKALLFASDSLGFALNEAKVANFHAVNAVILGQVSMRALETRASAQFANCRFGSRRENLERIPEKSAPIINGPRMTSGVSISFVRCSFHGTVHLSNISAGKDLSFEQCFYAPFDSGWSVELASSKIENIVAIIDSLVMSGVQMPVLNCSELQFEGNIIHPGGDHVARSNYAIWGSECTFGRRVSFSLSRSREWGATPNSITGLVDFSTSKVGERFLFRSTSLAIPDEMTRKGEGCILDLSRMMVEGDLVIGPGSYSVRSTSDLDEASPRIEGCVNLDDVQIGRDIVIHDSTICAVGPIARPDSRFESEERVTKRKRGVAVSLRDASIGGELELGRPTLRGIVDLRDARVGIIVDGGGDRWRAAGIEPGQLLLDGLVYRDLDDIEDGDEARSRPNRKRNPVRKRLAWLGMQYEKGRPNPVTFVPQPYEQLASIFAAEGNDKGRRRVIIEKRDLMRRHGRLGPLNRAVQWWLRIVSNYGYSPGRATLWSLVYIALGTLAAFQLYAHGAMILASTDADPSTMFDPVSYALDSAIPLIDLNHDSAWTIDPAAFPNEWSARTVVIAKALYEILGMLLVSITVLTLAGTLRERD